MDVNRFLKKNLCDNILFLQHQFSILQKAVVVETNSGIFAALEIFLYTACLKKRLQSSFSKLTL